MAKRAYAFDENGKNRADKAIRWVEGFREAQTRRQRRFGGPFDDLRIYNGTNSEMPQYGVGRVTGINTVNGERVVDVEQPSTTFGRVYLVNSGGEVAYQKVGTSKNRPLVKVLYDTGTPAAGETWGAKPGQWAASKGYPGFTVLGVVDATAKIMLARVEPYDTIIGKLTGALTDGANTVNVWAGDGGSEAVVSGWTVSARPWFDIGSCAYPVSTTAKVVCKFIDGQWYIMPMAWDRTAISGWSASERQYLRHDASGCLEWTTPGTC
jgi:hypothetical protein